MDKTPLEMAEAYAKGNEAIQDAYTDGFVAGISFEIERRTKKTFNDLAPVWTTWDIWRVADEN